MEHIWTQAEDLRRQYEVLRDNRIPIDIFTFAEIDLALDPIPFDV